jgi:oligopeptide transport system ATP-binding protein
VSDLVVVDELTKRFRARRGVDVLAVDAVGFRVPRGGALAIVGESGSGKTTVARCLAGLETPTSGTIEVGGERLDGHRRNAAGRRALARRIQLVFQDPYASLDPRQRIGAALEEALGVHGGGGDAGALLDRVGLPRTTADAYPRRLSGGQRQRVAIARALAAEPEVLVFDESVAALDVSIQAQILNLIADLRDSTGLTTIFISHDLAVVRQVSTELLVMRAGRIVERGATAAVIDAPTDPYTQRLVASVPHVGWTPA